MGDILKQKRSVRLERSCRRSDGDWIRSAAPHPAFERIEAFFSGHAYDPHRHDTYAIGYTIDGVQSFNYRGERADSLGGNIIVIHPDELHDGHAGTSDGFHYRMLYVEPRLIQRALGEKVKNLPFVRTPVLKNPRLMEALHTALNDIDDVLQPLEVDEAIAAIADALAALDSTPGRSSPSRYCRVAVEAARQYLHANHFRVVASEELEAITDLDRYSLARHFRRCLGTSPYRYLTMRRLDYARAMIRAGHTLVETSLASGFSDQSHMTRHFKEAYGLCPSRWCAMTRSGDRISKIQ